MDDIHHGDVQQVKRVLCVYDTCRRILTLNFLQHVQHCQVEGEHQGVRQGSSCIKQKVLMANKP